LIVQCNFKTTYKAHYLINISKFINALESIKFIDKYLLNLPKLIRIGSKPQLIIDGKE